MAFCTMLIKYGGLTFCFSFDEIKNTYLKVKSSFFPSCNLEVKLLNALEYPLLIDFGLTVVKHSLLCGI